MDISITQAFALPPAEDVASWAYMAGLVDGEGSIAARDDRLDGSNLRIWTSMSSTNPAVMLWVQKHFGGKVVLRPARAAKHKPLYFWSLNLQQREFIAGLLPYLVIKRRHAEIVLELCELVGYRRRKFVPVDVKAMRAPLVAEIKQLNHRGVA